MKEGCSLPGIKIHDGESFEKALKRFSKLCEKSGVISDFKKHQRYEKPSEKKKREENAARRKMQKKMRQMSQE